MNALSGLSSSPTLESFGVPTLPSPTISTPSTLPFPPLLSQACIPFATRHCACVGNDITSQHAIEPVHNLPHFVTCAEDAFPSGACHLSTGDPEAAFEIDQWSQTDVTLQTSQLPVTYASEASLGSHVNYVATQWSMWYVRRLPERMVEH